LAVLICSGRGTVLSRRTSRRAADHAAFRAARREETTEGPGSVPGAEEDEDEEDERDGDEAAVGAPLSWREQLGLAAGDVCPAACGRRIVDGGSFGQRSNLCGRGVGSAGAGRVGLIRFTRPRIWASVLGRSG